MYKRAYSVSWTFGQPKEPAIILLDFECPGSREVCGLKWRRGGKDNAVTTATGGLDVGAFESPLHRPH